VLLALAGFASGVLFSAAASTLRLNALPGLRWVHLWYLAGAIGVLLALTRSRKIAWVLPATLWLLLLAVRYTPLMVPLLRTVMRSDLPAAGDAIVVLSAYISPEGVPNRHSVDRIAHAMTLVAAGYSRRVVVTRQPEPQASYVPYVRSRLAARGLRAEILETGTVEVTRDEAREVAAVFRRKGWRRLLLVSDPSHLRRAQELFADAGVPVMCSPCPTFRYDPERLATPDERLRAFHDWVRESFFRRFGRGAHRGTG
jgi:uncharacterized SAM-binding protein YcdF (DUF218 family)